MRSILYIIAVILVIGWAISVFMYAASGIINIILVVAAVALLLGIFKSTSNTDTDITRQ